MRLRNSLLAVSFLIVPALFADPPARVVRLNLTDGIVSFRPAGIDDWTDATVNRPLVEGDELWTDAASRAEMHIGSAAVRLAPSTSFSILGETDRVAQLRLTGGTLNVRVRSVGEDDVWEIDTPNASVTLLRPGRYRIDVSEDGYGTVVTARNGEAEVTAGDSAFAVHAGDRAEISGEAGQTHDIFDVRGPDAFDRWCNERDQREERLASLQHVPRDVVGYEDLDANGTWRFVAGYGWVWRPTNVAAGWAPYRYGHWAWVEPWGWTWIDQARWGFAPFHYGRWAYAGGGWVWVPGAIVHPVYAPALVAFGGGARWHAGLTLWWPLAPGEVYVPSYRVAPGYVRNINAPAVNVTQINVTNINVTNIHYRNQVVAGGVTAVSQEAFVSAKPVAAAVVPVSTTQAMSVQAIATTAPVAPRRASVLGRVPSETTAAAHPPQALAARVVVAKTPPPPPPVPFAAKQELLIKNPGQPLARDTVAQLRATGVAPATTRAVRPLTVTQTPVNAQPQPRMLKHTTETTTAMTTTSTPPATTSSPQEPLVLRKQPPKTAPVTTTSAATTTSAPATTTSAPQPLVSRRHAVTTTSVTTTSAATTTSAPATTTSAPQPPRRVAKPATEVKPQPKPNEKEKEKGKGKEKDKGKEPKKD